MQSAKVPGLIKSTVSILEAALEDNPIPTDYSGVWPITIRDTYGVETGHADPNESVEGMAKAIEEALATLSHHEARSEDERRLALIMADIVNICREHDPVLSDRIATLVEEADALV